MAKTSPKEVDFVIGYEFWKRELIGDTLLKLELERRGYTVELVNRCIDADSDWKRQALAPKVVIYPWIYTDVDVVRARAFRGSVSNIVNLQSEQIFSEYIMGRFSKFADGHAKGAYHVCWGDLTKERFLAAGVKEDHLRVCGDIHLDINHTRFDSLFPARDEAGAKYGLDTGKKWVMYLSNFKRGTLYPDRTAGPVSEKDAEVAAMQVKARSVTLDLMEQYLKKHDDTIFIYRPHPDEGNMDNRDLETLEKAYTGFRVIKEGSVQEWVRVCDLFLNYISTSVTDVACRHKNAALIRPEALPQEIDNDIFRHCTRCIEDLAGLEAFLSGKEDFSFAPDDVLQHIIANLGEDFLAYRRLADWLEEIHGKEQTDFSGCTGRRNVSLKHRIRSNLTLMRGSATFSLLLRTVFRPLYHAAETRDLHRFDGLPRHFHLRTFSEQREIVVRERQMEKALRPYVYGVAA